MTEYLAENSRLRQLSRRYSEGQIVFGEYRAVRREILEALEAGQVQVGAAPLHDAPPPASDSSPPALPVDPEAVFLKTMPPQVPVEEPVAAQAPVPAVSWDGHTRILAAVLGVALVLALGALFYVFAL